MTTPYQIIFDKFIKQLKGDDKFFNYKNMSDVDIEELVSEHLNSLLNNAVDLVYKHGLPDVDLYDKDDILACFNIELTKQEIALLVELMYFSYVSEERNKVKAFSLVFKSSELNVFSPANERKSTLDMIDGLESKSIASINNYLSRDRETWSLKSIYK